MLIVGVFNVKKQTNNRYCKIVGSAVRGCVQPVQTHTELQYLLMQAISPPLHVVLLLLPWWFANHLLCWTVCRHKQRTNV